MAKLTFLKDNLSRYSFFTSSVPSLENKGSALRISIYKNCPPFGITMSFSYSSEYHIPLFSKKFSKIQPSNKNSSVVKRVDINRISNINIYSPSGNGFCIIFPKCALSHLYTSLVTIKTKVIKNNSLRKSIFEIEGDNPHPSLWVI